MNEPPTLASDRVTGGEVHVLGARLRAWLDDHHDELVTIRRHLHAHPELSGQEHATTAYLAERLAVAGLSPRVLACGTGLVCDIGEGDGPLVALRADIDALAMADEKDVHYRSQVPGVAHACGHDVHTTVVLGAGLYLAHVHHHLAGRVRLIFQPAEEAVPGGAREVIADHGLDEVAAIVAVHCEPKLEVGSLGLRRGEITSATDLAIIRLSGPGGHTARPELTVDMVQVVGKVITELPALVQAELADVGPVKFVFGAVRSGDAGNVIPAHAELRASVRTPSLDVWSLLPDLVERLARQVVAGTGAEVQLDYVHGIPPVRNDERVTDLVADAIAEELAGHEVVEAPQSWGGDDFAWYTQLVPGTYVRLGTHDPDDPGPRLDLHAGHFDVDERAIGVGVRFLVAATQRLLADRATLP
jgi:amidohydrolase